MNNFIKLKVYFNNFFEAEYEVYINPNSIGTIEKHDYGLCFNSNNSIYFMPITPEKFLQKITSHKDLNDS